MKSPILALAAVLLFSVCAIADEKLPQANDPYFKKAAEQLAQREALVPNTGKAKNIILMIGDGMGIPMVTATRIYQGQAAGKDGVTNKLAFEQLPYAALSRTYSADAQVTDSAPSATAMTSGVKLRNDVLGLNADAAWGDCAGSKGKEVRTIFEMAELAGKATGAITTTRITHATPAAAYAHTPNRDWENDAQLKEAGKGCKDIADQLVSWPFGDGLDIAMGGGRTNFLPDTEKDPEDEGKTGERKDGRDLTKEWVAKGNNHVVIYDKRGFDALDVKSTPKILGLFQRSHMTYEADRAKDKLGEPSLAEMTKLTLDVLKQHDSGYVLMIEGGRIDHAEHEGNAARALSETAMFDEAVKVVLANTDPKDTLVVVTADHSHTMTIAGYPKRDNPILGKVVGVDGKVTLADDGKPYTTINFANGPGGLFPVLKKGEAKDAAQPAGPRPDLSDVDTEKVDFIQQAGVPMASETHGGEDVAIYASGPQAYLFGGTVDENYIYHVMAKASGLGQ
ncbi:alkaline phosphatase [Aestuariivirga litoralis]|uniref:alkaline phosphatase n=1 Tax=Aestuariivirga litoralis TaxID=2650924 RepID=UPI0018C77119|nr:alkaline phosphatase [Aestuariivirga litoralis]MBG1231235.1 alkaline phosphatase [Aestuariivirga litoralis]